ncbi:Peptidase family M23 [Geopseudomonas sagittaria]|uniref:Peptidase family M23 n=1 Tax=Geopseudomonas sagittaria TaxID=1135990 RepID=A0A1I5NW06_9GAMM|nr:M23 family metallopeptidase [Pseudomonas sagittaria]SFP25917.1 Peptidase family M23 [Pseudomonas sagittaria]
MKLFSPSSRSLTRDAIKVVSLRRLLAPALGALLVLNLGVFVGGVWVGRGLSPAQPPLAEVEAVPSAEDRFAIDRVGVLVGRLKSLESDVLALGKMLGEHKKLTREVSSLDPALLPALVPDKRGGAGQGGVLLPPQGCSGESLQGQAPSLADLPRTEEATRCLRSVLDGLLESVAKRNAALMTIPSRRPVVAQARFGSAFGNRVDPFNRHLAFHSGVDFSIHTGAAVLAAAGGRVRFAGRNGGYGKLLEIDHGNGLVTRYAHLSRMDVRKGEVVTPGQRIGAVGSTGRSTGPHLHFEVLRHGRFVDPQRFLALGEMERDADAVALD